jgi:hypothetical protein
MRMSCREVTLHGARGSRAAAGNQPTLATRYPRYKHPPKPSNSAKAACTIPNATVAMGPRAARDDETSFGSPALPSKIKVHKLRANKTYGHKKMKNFLPTP